MRLAEFLAEILTAHGQVLLRLAALIGEERLLDLLERAEELYPLADEDVETFSRWEKWLRSMLVESPGDTPSHAMAEIQSAVNALNLPEVLEFYVWAYPTYRSYIETGIKLSMRIPRLSATGAPAEKGCCSPTIRSSAPASGSSACPFPRRSDLPPSAQPRFHGSDSGPKCSNEWDAGHLAPSTRAPSNSCRGLN